MDYNEFNRKICELLDLPSVTEKIVITIEPNKPPIIQVMSFVRRLNLTCWGNCFDKRRGE